MIRHIKDYIDEHPNSTLLIEKLMHSYVLIILILFTSTMIIQNYMNYMAYAPLTVFFAYYIALHLTPFNNQRIILKAKAMDIAQMIRDIDTAIKNNENPSIKIRELLKLP